MQVDCPSCGALIEDQDINVKTDVAFCRDCDSGHKLSLLVHGGVSGPGVREPHDEPIEVDIHNPPAGAWFEQMGSDIRVGATCRVVPLAIFLVPFTALWAGGSMAGIYGSQIAKGEFDPVLSLFGLPFLIGSIFLTLLTLTVLFGRMEVTIRDREGVVFTGIGPIGRRKRFNTDDVTVVRQEQAYTSSTNNRPTKIHYAIVLDGAKKLKFASMISDERRRFVMGVLQKLLAK